MVSSTTYTMGGVAACGRIVDRSTMPPSGMVNTSGGGWRLEARSSMRKTASYWMVWTSAFTWKDDTMGTSCVLESGLHNQPSTTGHTAVRMNAVSGTVMVGYRVRETRERMVTTPVMGVMSGTLPTSTESAEKATALQRTVPQATSDGTSAMPGSFC
jgi:hypothetical protein